MLEIPGEKKGSMHDWMIDWSGGVRRGYSLEWISDFILLDFGLFSAYPKQR